MRINQTELARKLGLSQRTISAVLAGTGRISEPTRKRVLQAAQQHGYVRNDLAMGLRRGTTLTIGLIWDLADPWTGDSVIALQLTPEIRKAGYSVNTADTNEDTPQLIESIDHMLARGVDALVIRAIPSQLSDPEVLTRLRQIKAVLAVTREPMPDFPGDVLVHDRNQAIEEVVAHLARTGRKNPVMALDIEQESNPPKFEIFRQACIKHGIGHPDQLLLPLSTPGTPQSVGETHRTGLRAFFPDEVRADAIFCFNDMGAMYVMRELQDRGLKLPEDVAVIGFNDSPVGQIWKPALATGDRLPREVTTLAARLLKERLAQPNRPRQEAVVHMKFVWRESAG